MMIRDSLGVPLEPEDVIIVATDWQGEPLQVGDEVYDTSDGFVLVEDIADYHGGVKVLNGNDN